MMAMHSTFQSLIDDKMTVTAYCHNPKCHHSQKLDLERLKGQVRPRRAGHGVGHTTETELQEVRQH